MLRSFAFHPSWIENDIWDLFKEWEYVDAPFEYVIEIIEAAKSGKINFDNFNLSAYNKTIRKHHTNEDCRRKNKVLHIMSDIEDVSVEPYGVPESVVSKYVEQDNEYEILENKDELAYAVKKIRGLEIMAYSVYRLDIIHCIRQALKGVPESINALKRLVVEDPDIGELIRIVLESGQSFTELFPEIA